MNPKIMRLENSELAAGFNDNVVIRFVCEEQNGEAVAREQFRADVCRARAGSILNAPYAPNENYRFKAALDCAADWSEHLR